MKDRFDSKVALGTGGNSGLAQAIALASAGEGTRVVVAARRGAEGKATVAMIKQAGGEAMVEACVSTHGGLHCAVNNAGIMGTLFTQTADYEEEVWDKVMDINLKGVAGFA